MVYNEQPIANSTSRQNMQKYEAQAQKVMNFAPRLMENIGESENLQVHRNRRKNLEMIQTKSAQKLGSQHHRNIWQNHRNLGISEHAMSFPVTAFNEQLNRDLQ
jgi:hypothetical protein